MANLAEVMADVERLEREQGTAPRLPGQHGPDAGDGALARAAAHASRLPASVEGHGGDAALWHAAKEMAALGLNEVDALAVLETYYSPRCTPPWDRQALQHKVERAVEEQTKLWDMYPPARARALAVAEAVPITSADAHYDAATTGETGGGLTWADFSTPPAPRDYRVNDLEWGEGRPLGVLATFNASKTLTTKQMLLDYALGRDVLGHFKIGTRTSGKVLDLCWEQFGKGQWVYERLARAAGIDPRSLADLIRFGRPPWYLSDGMSRPRNPELMAAREDELCALCEGFEICNVDPYSAASLGLDENGSEFQGPARMLERISEATGCAFMVNVHRGRDQEAEHARGHSSIDDAFDTTVLIAKHDPKAPNTRLMKCLKRPMYGFEPVVLQIEDLNEDGSAWHRGATDALESWGVRVVVQGVAPKRFTDAAAGRTAKVLEALGRFPGQWVSVNKLVQLGGTGCNPSTLKETLYAAHVEGLVHRSEQGAGKSATFVYCLGAPKPATAALDVAQATRSQSRFAGLKSGR
jgi:hypothetical protein